jgi:hypothetical protein
MSYYLFLDDSRKPSEVHWVALPENVAWVVAKSYQEFTQVISELGLPKFITYDCDLCDEHYQAYFNLREAYPLHYRHFKTKCGIDCIDYLLKLCKKRGIKHPEHMLHTKNHYAIGVMASMIALHNAKHHEQTTK